ncbi:uncharacterized protein LOC104923228 [Larimichthys crocea]|uniref:uncharacterized protein LOC104923228 n=1 Tax=Larimichthys crocea TaxID=215358 RepID=UPI000F5F94A7|nr:uncharacterized protein LOC104923228 [Larimichthys crocea]
MKGGKYLLLLAAFVLQARCQQDLQVTMSPPLNETFSGDLIYLTCNNIPSGSEVMWYLNGNQKVMQVNKTLKIPVADPVDSGTYHCESNGKKSNGVSIDVKENIPIATLKIKTGQPVMRPGESVVLQLDNDDGLQGWMCRVYRGHETKRIVLRSKDNPKSLSFQSKDLNVQETIYWCTDSTQQRRSNQITVRTSGKHISLEMYPQPAIVGENLILKCYVWGTDKIRHVVFYKKGEMNDWKVILESRSSTYKIPDVTESAKGQYKCNAIYTHVARTYGPSYNVTSDIQEVFVQTPNVKAVVSEKLGLSCSCPRCPSDVSYSYRWYYKKTDGQSWTWMDSNAAFMMPKESATYACSAVWNNGRSFLSNGYYYRPPIKVFMIILIVLLVLLCLAATAAYILWKRRNTSGPIYEDVGLRQRDRGDDKYEMLQKTRGDQKEAEYDTLNPEAPGRERKEGNYEALKGGTKEVYHTLGAEEAAGGAREYEALKKEGMKEGEYHTLGMQGAAGGGREYEALRKEGMKEEEYHTLGMQGTAGGGRDYEALRKEGMKEGVYHTLGMEGAAGGEV